MTTKDPIPSYIAGSELPRRSWRSRTIATAGALTMTAAALVGCGSSETVDASAQPVAPPTAEQTVAPPIEDPGANLEDLEVPEPVPLELPSEAELVERFSVELPSDADPSDVLAAWVQNLEDFTNAAGTQNAADSRDPYESFSGHAIANVSPRYYQAWEQAALYTEYNNDSDATAFYNDVVMNHVNATAANMATRAQEGVEPFTQSLELKGVEVNQHFLDNRELYDVPAGSFLVDATIVVTPNMSSAELSEYIGVDSDVVDIVGTPYSIALREMYFAPSEVDGTWQLRRTQYDEPRMQY